MTLFEKKRREVEACSRMLTVKLKKIAEMKRLGPGWQEIKKQEKTKLNKNARKTEARSVRHKREMEGGRRRRGEIRANK